MGVRYAKLAGVGSHLPGPPVGNDHFSAYLDTSDEWIKSRTGIKTRHFAPKGSKIIELAEHAARDALASASIDLKDVDALIVATSTPDQFLPASSCQLQHRLGISGCPAFDVQAACSGFVYAMAIAHGMISAGTASCVLIAASEIFSRWLDWQDRGSCILFGDGAGAAVVTAADEPGVIAVDIHADGEHTEALEVPGHVADGQVHGSALFRMNGRAVYKMAVESMTKSSITVCEQAGCEPYQVDWFVAHQANLRIIDAVASRLAIKDEGVLRTVVNHANTSAASIPLALASVWDQIKPGDRILLSAAGAGFTWGSVLMSA